MTTAEEREYAAAEARGDLIEALLPEAAGLAVSVREGTQEQIAAQLAGLGRRELEALAVILAALVDPDRSMKSALGWLTFDEHGSPLPYPSKAVRPIRAIAKHPVDPDGGVDMVAVDHAISGNARLKLRPQERTAAVHLGMVRGMSYDDVAARLGMDREAVKRSWERVKKRAREAGQPIPQRPYQATAA